MGECQVDAFWDGEAGVWVATSEDLPGLVTEAETVEMLMDKLRVMIPELMSVSGHAPVAGVPFRLRMERSDIAKAA
jgi:hypothetical protein